MEYIRICETVEDKGKLIPADFKSIYDHVGTEKPYYRSIFFYSEDHYKQFKEKGSIAGITDVTTNRLVFDFDSKSDLELARKDAEVLCTRLIEKGVPQHDIQICFSGSKGFSVEVETTSRFTPAQLENINLSLAGDLKTNDKVITNASRIFRIPQTRHDKSGLYKLPITLSELCELPSEVIKEQAKSLDNLANKELGWNQVVLPESFAALATVKPAALQKREPVEVVDTSELDFKSKPKGFSNCKFAIMNGFFDEGHRSLALSALAATCRAAGYPKEITYNVLKGAARLQAQRNHCDVFPKSEIWYKVIGQVYGDNWKGAQYSCRKQGWLKDVCDSLGHNRCKQEDEKPFFEINDTYGMYKDFATNIEKNTIKTGILAIDENVQITTHQSIGLLGAPASGKTSLALNLLNHTSKAGISSVFISADMAAPLVVQKKLQRLTGFSGKQVQRIVKEDPKQTRELFARLDDEYKNVKFSFSSGQSVADMKERIMRHQDMTGDKVKLLLVDYLECIAGPFSDSNANQAFIANSLKDVANEMGICVITLVQPPKSAGDASCPLTSMRQIKGSSTLEQAFAIVLGIFREGFSPHRPEDDRFITINALKNRMGALFQADCAWDGVRGHISDLTDDGYQQLEELRERKKRELQEKIQSTNFGL